MPGKSESNIVEKLVYTVSCVQRSIVFVSVPRMKLFHSPADKDGSTMVAETPDMGTFVGLNLPVQDYFVIELSNGHSIGGALEWLCPDADEEYTYPIGLVEYKVKATFHEGGASIKTLAVTCGPMFPEESDSEPPE